MEYCSAARRRETLPFATMCVDLEGLMLSEVNQTEKNGYCVIPLKCTV